MARSESPAAAEPSTLVGRARARPLRADAQRNRDRVLVAARAAFAAEGSDASLDEIAREAGVGAGTVYRHFATKEALFEAVVLDRMAELARQGHERLDASEPGPAFLSFVALLAREAAQKRDIVETFSSDGLRLTIGSAPVFLALVESLDELLQRAQEAGAVRMDVGVDDVMALLTGSAFAMCHAAADDEQADRILAVLCDGLRADPGGR
jgi:AcrR family transcriptional regulator